MREFPAVVDTHFHLWDLDHPVLRYTWLTRGQPHVMLGEIDSLCRTYLLDDFRSDAERFGVRKAVHVQCADGPTDRVPETQWLQEMADLHDWPHAIVAFVDLQGSEASGFLERQAEFASVRGIRDLIVGRPFVWEDKRFRANVRLLGRFGLHYELRARVPELMSACELARAAHDVPMVLTHAGLPIERGAECLAAWMRGIGELSRCENVMVKLSGFGMMSHINATPLTVDAVRPFVDVVVERFGCERVMFGGNWPVDGLSCGYGELLDVYRGCLTELTAAELRSVFATNAESFYRMPSTNTN